LILRHGDDADAKGQKKGKVFFHVPKVNRFAMSTLRKIANTSNEDYGKSQKPNLTPLD
jgi:hypothetical protein